MPTYNRTLLAVPLLAPMALAVSSCFASELKLDTRIERIVVTANRIEQPADEVMAQTTIISRTEIANAGAATLMELLQRSAGVEIRPLGGPGQPAGVFIRGANAGHTLVLVDGQRVSSSTSGSTAFENLSLDLIERIEVIKGPLSGLYGSDAIGGVVQIFTRDSKVPRLTGDVGFGSHGQRTFNAGFTAVEGNTALSLNAGHNEVNAPSATNPAAGTFTYNPDRDPYSNTNVVLKLSHTLWQQETLSFSVWQSKGKTHFDDGPGDNAVNTQTLTGVNFGSENHFAPWWKSKLLVGRTIDDSRIDSQFPGSFKTTQNQFSWQNEFASPVGKWLLGTERREETVSGTTDYDRRRRTTNSLFAGVSETLGDTRFAGNIRRDSEEQFGRNISGGASYGIQLAKDELIYISTGKAFHAPSFNDLYYPGFSNPNLKPERSRAYEYGWRLSKADYRFDLAIFENTISDLVVFDFATLKPQNVANARIRGWEASGDTTLWGINARASVTAQQPENRDTGKVLQSRARQFGSILLSKPLGNWFVSTGLVANGVRYDSADQSPLTRMNGYVLWNANLRYRIDKVWRIELIATNLADRHYQLAQGYNPLGRSIVLNLRAAAF